MLVKDCMTRHPVMIAETTAAAEAQKILAENNIRHLPVIGDGKRLVGLITRQSLAIETDKMGSLNIWEISRYLANLTAGKLMTKNVYTIAPNKTVERAASTMMEHKIGCLVVMEDDIVVGILSEIDLLRAFQLMLGLPEPGIRVTIRMPNKRGEFAKLTGALGDNGIGVMGIGTFPTPKQDGYYDTVLKITDVTAETANEVLSQIPDQEIVDIRDVV